MLRRLRFLWHLVLAFGMIFSVNAAAEEAKSSPDAADLYSAVGKRDPFVPLVTLTSKQVRTGLLSAQSVDDIAIEGIIVDPKNGSMVIVNGALLKEGQEEGPIKVIKIDPQGALFSVNGVEGYKSQYSDQPVKIGETT